MLSPEQYCAECDCACYQRFQRDVQHSKFPGAGKKSSFRLLKPQIGGSLYKRAFFLKKLIDVEKIFPYISARSSNAGATIW
ncbi:hypothetical protein AB2019_000284 [Salmonella enterica]|uniref:Uncharacterized protein n=1 Tax=Salmonella enterica TaxID=28901 RepID=A0A633FIJ0_SALER|nr:hypothetical protein [Salmonella enterica subsp. enterica serovar Enteritidis]EAA6276406.1 hypothetical protein [Salmonella enterica subsp. enterica serovar Telhashomer]EAO0388605.1 hypothetical protein [Salmonella enterica]EAO5525921.1 hypothetical protein [Salmonella enterica subsp. enterica serovar Hvittingfoss]EBS2232730.1 hypothetical protein [Salmonella enterica subsp. enterica serovar Middlesbrough]EBY6523826.1 hypothetical protein [Salmonella enterica subsp. enterica serovar Livings